MFVIVKMEIIVNVDIVVSTADNICDSIIVVSVSPSLRTPLKF